MWLRVKRLHQVWLLTIDNIFRPVITRPCMQGQWRRRKGKKQLFSSIKFQDVRKFCSKIRHLEMTVFFILGEFKGKSWNSEHLLSLLSENYTFNLFNLQCRSASKDSYIRIFYLQFGTRSLAYKGTYLKFVGTTGSIGQLAEMLSGFYYSVCQFCHELFYAITRLSQTRNHSAGWALKWRTLYTLYNCIKC